MAEKYSYKIHLWTRGTNSRIPVEDVDAEDRLQAVAIGLRFFQMRRFDFRRSSRTSTWRIWSVSSSRRTKVRLGQC
jgi:hypothetical protein